MASQTVGVLVIYRHGDRTAFYQNPNSYTASNTAITSLGEAQAFQLGQLIRSRYIDQSSPYAIQGFNDQVLDANQVYFSADAGGEGGVILDSAAALSQGAFPATTANNITLANGTTITSPLGGYQYVPIESVEVADDYTLESWTDCPAYTVDNTNWYNSPAFLQKAQQSQASLTAFSSVVGARNVSFANMYNIFDYINVEYLHSADFMRNTSDSIYRQARDLANWHEYYSFSDPDPAAIGSIPGSAFLPVLFNSFNTLTNASQPIKLRTVGISYKPFIGFFNLTGVAQTYPEVAGIVDYAAALAFEIRYVRLTNSYTVTLQFKNGTADNDFRTLNMFGSSDAAYPLLQFVSRLQPYSVDNLTQWCQMCNNTKTRGCDAIYALNQTTTQLRALQSGGSSSVSPTAAGFIGAAVTLALTSAVLFAMYLLGMAAFGRKGMRQRQQHRDQSAETYILPAYDSKRQETAQSD